MARTNNLTNFLTDVSSAIKQKTGDNTPIPASEFDTEILSIETGGNYQSKTLNVTQNGNYNLLPDQEFDALSNVNISVSVSPVLQNKTVTENGSYSADSGYDGLGTVIVNVPSGGSGDVKLFETEQAMQADPNPSEGDLAVVYRNDIVIPSPGDTISSITPPDTVIFDTAISSMKTLNVFGTNVYLQCRLTKTLFRISDMGRVIYPEIRYTSSDGITYTRTDTGAESYDLGENLTIPSTADVNILKFLQSGGMVFEGLYEYVSRSDDYFTFGNFTNVSGQLYPDYVAQVAEPREKIMNILTPYLKENGYTLSYLTLVRKSTTEFVAYCSTANNAPKVLLDSSFIWLNSKTYISPNGYSGESVSYKIDINTETQQCLISPITATNSVTVGGVNRKYFEEITDYTFGMWFHPQRSFTVAYDNDGSWTTTSRPVSDLSVFKYRVASTQFSADESDLFSGMTAYSKKGIITGDGTVANKIGLSSILNDVSGINTQEIDLVLDNENRVFPTHGITLEKSNSDEDDKHNLMYMYRSPNQQFVSDLNNQNYVLSNIVYNSEVAVSTKLDNTNTNHQIILRKINIVTSGDTYEDVIEDVSTPSNPTAYNLKCIQATNDLAFIIIRLTFSNQYRLMTYRLKNNLLEKIDDRTLSATIEYPSMFDAIYSNNLYIGISTAKTNIQVYVSENDSLKLLTTINFASNYDYHHEYIIGKANEQVYIGGMKAWGGDSGTYYHKVLHINSLTNDYNLISKSFSYSQYSSWFIGNDFVVLYNGDNLYIMPYVTSTAEANMAVISPTDIVISKTTLRGAAYGCKLSGYYDINNSKMKIISGLYAR